MDEFSNLFEEFVRIDTPEEVLVSKIEREIWDLVPALKGEYWLHDDIIYSEWDVLKWLKENRPEFYRKALEQPETIEGSDNLTAALEALGLMKEWSDVKEEL